MSKFWDWLNRNPGAYGADSFEGSVSYDSSVVTPVDSWITGKPVGDTWHSGQMIQDSPVVPFSEDSKEPETPSYYFAPVNKPEYISADLAKAYGMDVATAYQEALANTAHQREIADLKSAGLNPVLSARYSGASGVSGASVMQTSGSRSSGSSSSDSPLGKLLAGAGLLTGIVAGIATKNPQVTTSIASASRLFSSLFD